MHPEDPDEFRTWVRSWYAEHVPAQLARESAGDGDADYVAAKTQWLRELNTVGFAAPHLDKNWGGGGYSIRQQAMIYEEATRGRAPDVDMFILSVLHMPATLLNAGTPQQQDEFIRAGVDGVIWCQGFSEPGSGSDLASLRTRAERSGDEYIVNGQKIWSSHSRFARWCLLLARTDPAVPKHRGISYFILDMQTPGVDVRPIRQSTGVSEFCEIFLQDVRIPASRRIGQEGDGWSIAQSTLVAERGPNALPAIESLSVGLDWLGDELDLEVTAAGDLTAAQATYGSLLARSEAIRSLVYDAVEAIEYNQEQVNLASVIKVATSELLRAVTDFGCRSSGVDALFAPIREGHARPLVSGEWFTDYINSWGLSIAQGTNEIQRNIIAERILSLPREVRRS